MGASAGMQAAPRHHPLRSFDQEHKRLAWAGERFGVHQFDIAAPFGDARHFGHEVRPAGNGHKLPDEPGVGEVELFILEGKGFERVGFQKLEVLRELPSGTEPSQRCFHRRAVNVEAHDPGLLELQRHLAAPDAGAAPDIQNRTRLAQRSAIVFPHGHFEQVMLEIEPPTFGNILGEDIGAGPEDTPPTEPGPAARGIALRSLCWLRSAAKPLKEGHTSDSSFLYLYASVVTDHRRTLPSWLPVANSSVSASPVGGAALPRARVACAAKATTETAWVCPAMTASGRPVSTAQSRPVPSALPVARKRLSGLKATLRMLLLCSARRWCCWPVWTVQMCVSPVSSPQPSQRPSGLKATLVTHCSA